MTIAEAVRRHEAAMNGLDNAISDILNEVEDDIVKMQQDRIFAGELVGGGPIVPEYSMLTKVYKAIKQQPYDHVTLKDTGSFHANIFAAQFGDKLLIDSNDDKSVELQEYYGEDIFGLTKENKEEIQPEANKLLVRYYKSITGFN